MHYYPVSQFRLFKDPVLTEEDSKIFDKNKKKFYQNYLDISPNLSIGVDILEKSQPHLLVKLRVWIPGRRPIEGYISQLIVESHLAIHSDTKESLFDGRFNFSRPEEK